jgi:hypothetical protein
MQKGLCAFCFENLLVQKLFVNGTSAHRACIFPLRRVCIFPLWDWLLGWLRFFHSLNFVDRYDVHFSGLASISLLFGGAAHLARLHFITGIEYNLDLSGYTLLASLLAAPLLGREWTRPKCCSLL